ncbi:helix-turn-helix domain-containing protein [Bariatricus sp. SGI.019]|uniref:helix-turn-helix domain-containing protein n=1 Tax=Bariatricus sp. SGI.019 TaxID=3420548 RepID=UPI003CFFCF8C
MKYTGDVNEVMKMIKHKMIDNDVTQKDICNATGWSKGTVSNLLGGKTENPSLKIILQLCDAIGCDFMIDITERK